MLIKLIDPPKFLFCVIAEITHCPPHYRVVLLFHKTVVILSVTSASGKGDTLLLTVIEKMVIDKLSSTVRINPQKLKRWFFAYILKCFKDPHLCLVLHVRNPSKPLMLLLSRIEEDLKKKGGKK